MKEGKGSLRWESRLNERHYKLIISKGAGLASHVAGGWHFSMSSAQAGYLIQDQKLELWIRTEPHIPINPSEEHEKPVREAKQEELGCIHQNQQDQSSTAGSEDSLSRNNVCGQSRWPIPPNWSLKARLMPLGWSKSLGFGDNLGLWSLKEK